ncbi:MOSC domain-containing protein [Azohydromonas aeria]|uniref:MOSC domain-containing protein n=1 Tax=Azohydromonas aeria TaxID=2590212 RepID=UPI0012F9BA86|nr:MOSC domain-containing protein [Azohydromonas aeria]
MLLRELVARVPGPGRLEAIWLRPARGTAAVHVADTLALAGRGLQGDRSAAGRGGGRRQVTLIQAEHLPVLASLLNRPLPDASLLRRNLVVSGLNLAAARSPLPVVPLRLWLGDEVELEVTGPCEPCSRMEEVLGPGGYAAMRGHGGVTARVLRGGRVRVGDAVRCVAEAAGAGAGSAGMPARQQEGSPPG